MENESKIATLNQPESPAEELVKPLPENSEEEMTEDELMDFINEVIREVRQEQAEKERLKAEK